MEKDWIAQREYHEESGRMVRRDKFLTAEDERAKAGVNSAEWRLKNPKSFFLKARLQKGLWVARS